MKQPLHNRTDTGGRGETGSGRLYIVGTGPGDRNYLAPLATRALQHCTDVVGYGLYLDLLGDLIDGKTHHRLPLGKEVQRARLALELARAGKVCSLVSSGDAGIYAMATVVFQLLDENPDEGWGSIDIEVVPGISAVQLAAARSGAPLAHDFCTVSLSDLLTPWTVIEQRLHCAGQGDFVVALYNPVSVKRSQHLAVARDILLEYRSAGTPVVIARNLGRETEDVRTVELGAVDPDNVDMLTLVVVGNSETRCSGGWVYTPRGYRGAGV